MDKKAVVLAGGGARGSYQIGVWQALQERNYQYRIVTGTSVGALNGALMVQGDYAETKELWEHMQTQHVIVGNITGDKKSLDGRATLAASYVREALVQKGIDNTPLQHIVRQMVDEKRFFASPIDFGLVTVEYPSLQPLEVTKKQIPAGKVADYLLASSAVFPAFKPMQIDGSFYIDGGYHDNIPIRLALQMGATEIVAVDLAGPGQVPKHKNPHVPIRYIRSYWDLGPLLVFDPVHAKRNIRLGYLDTLKAYGELEGMAYAFRPGELQGNTRHVEQAAERVLYWLFPEFSGQGKLFDSFTRRNLIKTLKDHRCDSLNMGSAILAAAELAGEILRLSPLEIYTFYEFNRALLHKLEEHMQPLPWENDANGLLDLNVKELVSKLSGLKRETVLGYLVRYIHFAVSQQNDILFPMQAVATFLPKEFLAAAYLCFIQKAKGGMENGKNS